MRIDLYQAPLWLCFLSILVDSTGTEGNVHVGAIGTYIGSSEKYARATIGNRSSTHCRP